jgi:hypothetical protein
LSWNAPVRVFGTGLGSHFSCGLKANELPNSLASIKFSRSIVTSSLPSAFDLSIEFR